MPLITQEFLKMKFKILRNKYFEFNKQISVSENVELFLRKVLLIQRSQMCRRETDLIIWYNFENKEILAGIIALFWEKGYTTYVLWLENLNDEEIPFSYEVKEKIKRYIDSCSGFIYAFSENSPVPLSGKWLLAYAEGKLKERSAIMPITNNETDYYEVPENLWYSLHVQVKYFEHTGEELCVVATPETWGSFAFWVKRWGLFENPLNDYMSKKIEKHK